MGYAQRTGQQPPRPGAHAEQRQAANLLPAAEFQSPEQVLRPVYWNGRFFLMNQDVTDAVRKCLGVDHAWPHPRKQLSVPSTYRDLRTATIQGGRGLCILAGQGRAVLQFVGVSQDYDSAKTFWFGGSVVARILAHGLAELNLAMIYLAQKSYRLHLFLLAKSFPRQSSEREWMEQLMDCAH